LGNPTGDRFAKRLQPRLSIVVGKRDAAPNLFHIRRWMKVVRIGKFPGELLGQQMSHGRLAGPDDSDHDRNHGAGL